MRAHGEHTQKTTHQETKQENAYIYTDLSFFAGFFGFPDTEFDGWPASLPTIGFCNQKAKKAKNQ